MDNFPAVLMLKRFLSTDSCIYLFLALLSLPGARQWRLSDAFTVKATWSSGIQSVLSRDAFVGGPCPLPSPQHIDTPGPGTSLARVGWTLSNLSPPPFSIDKNRLTFLDIVYHSINDRIKLIIMITLWIQGKARYCQPYSILDGPSSGIFSKSSEK